MFGGFHSFLRYIQKTLNFIHFCGETHRENFLRLKGTKKEEHVNYNLNFMLMTSCPELF